VEKLKTDAARLEHLPAQVVLNCRAFDLALTTSHLHLQLPQASSTLTAAASLGSATTLVGDAILELPQSTVQLWRYHLASILQVLKAPEAFDFLF
jgi:hypothetical protein